MMDMLNVGKKWVVDAIMSYMNKYFISFTSKDMQLALLKGSCSFENLELNVKVIKQEFKLPFDVICGHVNNLNIEIPWYKLLSNVVIVAETIEFKVKVNLLEEHKDDDNELNSENNRENNSQDIEKKISYGDLYTKKLINTILENLSITCNNIIIKFIEEDMVIRLDIKLFTLSSTNDNNWKINLIINSVTEPSPKKWLLQKMGDINGFTISVNKINKCGSTDNFLEPLVLNESFSVRICCIFETPNSILPYFIQLDIFSSKITITFIKSHILIITEFLSSIKNKFKQINDEQNNDIDLKYDTSIPTSISETISKKETWMDWLNSLIPGADNQTSSNHQILNGGIYTNTLILSLDLGVEKHLNTTYIPSIKITANGLMFKIIHNPYNSTKIKFGISQISINSEDDCYCCLKDCFNNKKLYFSSGKMQDNDYLIESLFQENEDTSEETIILSLPLDEINNENRKKTLLKSTLSFSFKYMIYHKQIQKHIVFLEAGLCVINLTHELIPQLQCILNILLREDKDDPSKYRIPNDDYQHSSEEKSNNTNKSLTQSISYNFKISNIIIKILTVPSNTLITSRKQQHDPISENFPEALIKIREVQGSIIIPKNVAVYSKMSISEITEENQMLPIMQFKLWVNKIKAKVYKPNSAVWCVTRTLLRVNKIEWSNVTNCCLEEKSDSMLNIETITFESSKDDYLLFYYIIYSNFMMKNNQCIQLFINKYILNSKLLPNNLNSLLLKWTIDDINMNIIFENRAYNFEISLKNISAKMLKLMEKNDRLCSIIMSTLNEENIKYPLLHVIVQMPSTDNSETQNMSLIYGNVKKLCINIDPLIIEWLIYVPEPTMKKREKNILLNSLAEHQNESIRFITWRWLDGWKSAPVFVDFSSISLYFPNNNIVSVPICDEENMHLKKWIHVLVDHDVDIVVMSISSFSLYCALDKQSIESYFNNFPVRFPDSIIWYYDKSYFFPWEFNLQQLKCYLINKKYLQPPFNKTKVIDAVNVSGSFTASLIQNYDESVIQHLDSIINCHVSEPINIYVSKQQVIIVHRLLKTITHMLEVFSNIKYAIMAYEVECNNINVLQNDNNTIVTSSLKHRNSPNIESCSSSYTTEESILNVETYDLLSINLNRCRPNNLLKYKKSLNVSLEKSCSSNITEESIINVEAYNLPINENNDLNQHTMDINVFLNEVTVNFFKMDQVNRFEPLLYIYLYQPKICLLPTTENSVLYKITIRDSIIYTTPNEMTIKSELPDATDYSLVIFQTDSKTMSSTSNIDSDLLTMEISLSHDHPEISIDIERTINFTIHNITMIDTLLKTTDIFNQNDLSESILFKYSDLSTYCNYNFKENTSKDQSLESHENIEEDISYQEVFKDVNWTVNIKISQQLFFKLLTYTKDNIVFNVECIHFDICSTRGIRFERINGEITMNGLAVSVGNVYSDYFILYPTRIVVNTRLHPSNYESIKPTVGLNITMDKVSLDLSRNNCEILLLIWNVYRHLFETKNNSIQSYNEQEKVTKKIYFNDDFGTGKFTIINTDDIDIPKPYQIMISDNIPRKFEITWSYPQPRKLTKFLIDLELIYLYCKTGVKIELYLYDEMQTSFHYCGNSFLCPKHKQILPQFEMGKEIANTWRIIIDNEVLLLPNSKIQSLVSSIKIDSYYSPDFVPLLQMSLSVLSIEIHFIHIVQQLTCFEKYQCISGELEKHKLLLIQLDEIYVNLINSQKKEIITTAKGRVNSQLILYENLTEISILECPFNFTSSHTTCPTLLWNEYNIKLDSIKCQIGPSMINSLTAAIKLWFNPFYDVVPYVICNDTCYTIIFGQADTEENIVLNSLECYNYSWLIYAEKPCLKFAIKSQNDRLFWCDENIALDHENNKKYMTIFNSNKQTVILIASIQPVSLVSTKIVITSTLRFMNETEHLLDTRIVKIRNIDGQPDGLQTLTAYPHKITPSFMFEPDKSKLSIELRFSTYATNKSPWSKLMHMNDVNELNKNTLIISIPDKNGVETFSNILCHMVFETIDNISQTLILLVPTYVILSYLPNNTILNVVTILNGNEENSILEVESAIVRKYVQPADLPIVSLNDDGNDCNLDFILSLTETFRSSPVIVSQHIKPSKNSENRDYKKVFSIEEDLNDKYVSINTVDLKWPFIGHRFNDVQWKSGVKYGDDDVKTILQVQNYYDIVSDAGVFTRLILIRPWALIVNTTGQLISLHSPKCMVFCSLPNMSVIAPPDINDKVFYIEVNTDIGYILSPSMSFGNLYPKNRVDYPMQLNQPKSVIFTNSANSMVYFQVCLSDFHSMKILHLQSLYVATNCSSIDIDILAVCAMPTSNVMDVPVYSNSLFVNLPRTSRSLGKPLALWTLLEPTATVVRTQELDQYVIIMQNGNLSCPIKLSTVRGEEHAPAPVVFSSFERDVQERLLCVTLDNYDGQHVIAVHDQPYPQIVLYNRCPTTVVVTNSCRFKKPIRFTAEWNWSYEIIPGGISYLSFPELDTGKTIYFVVMDGKPLRTTWFASLMVNNSECSEIRGQCDRKINIKIFKKAFTWHVIFCPTDCVTNDNTKLNALKSLSSVNCGVKKFTFTLLVNEFNLKEILIVTFDNFLTTVHPNNDIEEEMEIVFSINNIQINNPMFHDGNFDFPIVIHTKQHKALDKFSNKQHYMKYVLQEINQLNQMDSVITIMIIIDKSSYSTPVILDLKVSSSILEISIEEKLLNYLLKYFKSFKIMPYQVEMHIYEEGFIPINVSYIQTFFNRVYLRSLKIMSFQLILNLRWSAKCFVSFNHLLFRFTELEKSHMNVTLRQLGETASIHYYNYLIDNVNNVIGSLDLLGAPNNFIYMAKKGLHDFTSMALEGYSEGPKGFLFSLFKGMVSLTKHLSLGVLLTVSSFANSWSRTFNDNTFLKYMTFPLIKILKILDILCTWSIDYLLYPIVDSDIN